MRTRRSRAHPLARLLSYGRAWRGQALRAALCSVLNKIFDLAPPFLIGLAIDVVVRKEASVLGAVGITGRKEQFVWLTAATAVIWSLESLFQYAHGVLWRTLAQSIQHSLRVDAYAHVQRLDMSWFETRSTGELMAVLNDDVNQLERFLDVGANDLIQTFTAAAAIVAVFFAVAPQLAPFAMLPVPFVLWGSFLFQRRIAPRYEAVREQVGLVNHLLANNLGGVATIKAFANEAHEVERLRARSDAYRQVNRRAIHLSSAFSPLIRMVIVVGFGATLIYGGWLAFEGRISVAVFSLMAFLTQRLLWPLTRLGETFDLYQRAMASTKRVLDLLDRKPQILTGATSWGRGDLTGEVRLDQVSFRYAGHERAVLEALELTFEARRTTAVVGPTGAGKSTLVKLLLRFYDPTEGRVLLDGHDLRQVDLQTLRDALGFVSQDVFLFHGTVRENVAYGRLDAPAADIVRACRLAEADAFIRALPQGYDTIVGERGQRLSGGQRQRVSLARAILRDPLVLLLDEATSAVDNETEAAIQRSLEQVSRGRTTIVIAHRLSTIRNADRIYVLAGGRVAEVGRHEDLVERNGLYAALWRVQTGEGPLPADPQTIGPAQSGGGRG